MIFGDQLHHVPSWVGGRGAPLGLAATWVTRGAQTGWFGGYPPDCSNHADSDAHSPVALKSVLRASACLRHHHDWFHHPVPRMAASRSTGIDEPLFVLWELWYVLLRTSSPYSCQLGACVGCGDYSCRAVRYFAVVGLPASTYSALGLSVPTTPQCRSKSLLLHWELQLPNPPTLNI